MYVLRLRNEDLILFLLTHHHMIPCNHKLDLQGHRDLCLRQQLAMFEPKHLDLDSLPSLFDPILADISI